MEGLLANCLEKFNLLPIPTLFSFSFSFPFLLGYLQALGLDSTTCPYNIMLTNASFYNNEFAIFVDYNATRHYKQ
jgi:hypothetical protein